MVEHLRRRSNSLRNGCVSADDLQGLSERSPVEDSQEQALEDFLQKKKSSFRQKSRAMSMVKLQVSRGGRRSSSSL